MQPYSLDLRQKIVDVYAEGKTSQRQIAKQFRVAYSFVRKLIKQYRETGEIAPKQRTGQNLIEGAGAKLIFLPPYSPDFSPIENCFSKIKSILRSIGARNYSGLTKAIDEAFLQVSLSDLQNWFSHCCYYDSPE